MSAVFRLTCLGLALSSLGCEINTKIDANGSVKGSVDGKGGGGGDGGGGGGSGQAISDGAVLLAATDGSCGNIWRITGETQSCDDCDLSFEVSLEAASEECFEVGDLGGDLVFRNDSAYFNGYYWGAAAMLDGEVVWYTYEHLDGPYYSYYYYGYIYY